MVGKGGKWCELVGNWWGMVGNSGKWVGNGGKLVKNGVECCEMIGNGKNYGKLLFTGRKDTIEAL